MKILIVEDHAIVREAVSFMLSTLEQKVVPFTAATCEEAFAVLDHEKDIGLVLMDLSLPGMSGTDGIGIMRTKYPDLPIVVLSATTDRAVIMESIRRGAMGFIPKTYSGESLIDILRFVLVHKGIFLPPEFFRDDRSAITSATQSKSPFASSPQPEEVTAADLGLTQRQAAVLYLVLQGKSNKAIARELKIECTTVRTHVTAVLRALNVTTRTEAVVAANRMKLVFPDVSERSVGGDHLQPARQ